MTLTEPMACRLPNLAVIEVRGTDATSFLQAQLGLDVARLGEDRAPLAAWHDAKGRLRALFRVLRLPERWLLILPESLGNEVARKLALFVLRADVALAVSSEWGVAALSGDASSLPVAADLGPGADSARAADTRHWIRIGRELLHVVAHESEIAALLAGLAPGDPELAELAEIELGIPALVAGLEEKYLPQMLNLDKLGAMSFDKGCYPGQEVIARVHHLGSVKRRLRRFAAERRVPLRPGSAISTADDHSVGEVVRSATHDGHTELLAVVELDKLDRTLFVDGAALTQRPLPYE